MPHGSLCGSHRPDRRSASIQQSGEWATVQFQDPDFGLRTGYVQTRFLRIQPAEAADAPAVPSNSQPARTNRRSETLGEHRLFLGGGFEGASISPNDSVLGTKSQGGAGGGFEAGYGVSRLLAIYGAFSAAGISGEADEQLFAEAL